jgi:pilus assembly protein Flp/PilA
MLQIMARVAALKLDRRGVTALEYGLIAALIAVVIIGAVTTLGSNLSTTFNNVATSLGTTKGTVTAPAK